MFKGRESRELSFRILIQEITIILSTPIHMDYFMNYLILLVLQKMRIINILIVKTYL